jgi:hypothetical protein
MMIQLSQTQERNFYLDFSATDYGLSLYQFTFTSMSTGSDSNFLLTPVSKTGRAYKFLFNLSSSESLFAGQYIVRVVHLGLGYVTTVTAYVQGSILVSGGNFTEYQSTNTTKYFEG